MSSGCLTMSKRELARAQLMLLIQERRRTQAQVGAQLGLTVRQVERPYRAYKTGVVTNDGQNWYLRRLGNATGSAACVEMPTFLTSASLYGSQTEESVFLGPYVPGKQCFLTGVGGAFTVNNSFNGCPSA
jgi:hypothetical protein